MHRKLIGTSTFFYHQTHFDSRPDLRDFLDSEVSHDLAERYPDTFVVLGGDGTLLRAIREHARDGRPFLGVNFGSRGNLMIQRDNLLKNLRLDSFPLIQGMIESVDTCRDFLAFNEVVLKSTSGRTIKVHYEVGDEKGSVAGDGVIVSTPCGSTGYNLAAGGPRMEQGSRTFIMSAIASFDPLDFRPIIYPDTQEISLTVHNDRGRPTSVYADGEGIIEHSPDPISLTLRKSDIHIQLYQSGSI